MRFVFITVLALLAFLPPARAGTFVPYLDGVPVMPGFAASTDGALIFDKPEGRVIEVDIWCAQTCPADAAIAAYYIKALETLGWRQKEKLIFNKGGEHLVIELYGHAKSPQKIIRFRSNG